MCFHSFIYSAYIADFVCVYISYITISLVKPVHYALIPYTLLSRPIQLLKGGLVRKGPFGLLTLAVMLKATQCNLYVTNENNSQEKYSLCSYCNNNIIIIMCP